MSFDLAIADNGDLILTGHRDLAGISGTALLEQRIKLRLRLHRGEWIYDLEGSLGSQLYTLSGTPSENATAYVDAYVRDALRDMEDISVVEVQSYPTTEDITLVILYQTEITGEDEDIPADEELQAITVTVPVLATNE